MNIDELNLYLQKESKNICSMNECTENEHNCESYAYINSNMSLLDICIPDYFQGSNKPYAAIPLPWFGTDIELEEEINEQTACPNCGEPTETQFEECNRCEKIWESEAQELYKPL